jgi:hypothetical protein
MRKLFGICAASLAVLFTLVYFVQFVGCLFSSPPTAIPSQPQLESPSANATQTQTATPSPEQSNTHGQRQVTPTDLEYERIAYGKAMQTTLYDQDIDADVDVMGPRHTVLRVKYALATKLFVYKLSQELQQTFSDMRALGFKKFIITDGYDRSWSWSL